MRIATCVLLLALAPAAAQAHDFTPGALALREERPRVFRFRWRPPVDSGTALEARPRFPRSCRAEGDLLSCRDLSESIVIEGLRDPRVRVVVAIERLDGRRREHVLSADDPRVELEAHDGSALAWTMLGAEHVLGGLDHLAFVLGLLLVTGLRRRIVLTITAFTVAHSLTLALAVLDVLRLPSAPVEATIAASIVLVAREALRPPDDATWTRRAPWAVALVFGLVHGLGFAGALEEIGLPRDSLGRALLLFNAGVELGQLAVVGIAVGVAVLARRSARASAGRRALAYGLGALGAFWLVARTAAIVTGSS